MNPNYVHTVTLYQRQQDGTYVRTVLHDVFWKSGIAVTQSGTEASQSNTFTVRIPADLVPDGLSVSLNNDMAILGECTDEVSNEKGFRAAEILARHKPEAFRITAFSDNTGHRMDKHYRIGGDAR